uniref:torsin-1A-interacting protein 2-like isoform X2 n=1 Tax=Gasterosteus aculeatus aculeatus TaxID=481459 RepID=UPI001A986113|nr:torsin-1A-interacting protein 2-like isoform X2 [Gasterosteus aculeatus aculeatus]
MDSSVSENKTSYPLRRSKRQSSGNANSKALTFEPTPRGPLKRTRKGLKNHTAPVPDVNGSGDAESDSGDEETSPSKRSRAETGGPVDGGGEENEMDVQESDGDLGKQADHEMDIIQESSHASRQPPTGQGDLQNVNLHPCVMLGECHRSSGAVNADADWMKTKSVKPSTKELVAPTKSARHNVLVTSMADYKKTMEAKANVTGIPTVKHHVPIVYQASEQCYTTRKRVNNVPTQRLTAPHQQKGKKKTAVINKSSGYSCRGFMWVLWRLVLLGLLCPVLWLAYKTIPLPQKTADWGTRASTAVNPERFADRLSLLETQFSRQRPELWRRSKIHLERHLKTARPKEPVSLIFTAGHGAERTLRCLAERLADAFSSALNASVLHIDGAGKAGLDSDQVKLDIDSQLQAAFEGNKQAAVIHRFEELPPGSTLIFYRYCDHENAAYKQAFLLFTVLLPQEEVTGDLSLKDLEERVHDYVKGRLVDSSDQVGFNEMDIDKYGGLWSRISHLILPVVSEREVEHNGC